MRFLSSLFSAKPISQSGQTVGAAKGVSNGDPVAVISRTDPMTGYKRPISVTGRQAQPQPLPSEQFSRPGFGFRQRERNLK